MYESRDSLPLRGCIEGQYLRKWRFLPDNPISPGNTSEDIPLPTIDIINNRRANKLVPTNLRQNNSPDQPVHTTSDENTQTDDDVDPVRQGLVYTGALRGDHGCDYEVDIADEEEDDDGEGGGEGRGPLVFGAVEIEPEKTACDEDVDYREGVCDDAILVSDYCL